MTNGCTNHPDYLAVIKKKREREKERGKLDLAGVHASSLITPGSLGALTAIAYNNSPEHISRIGLHRLTADFR